MLKAEEQMELVVLKKHGESIRALSRVRRVGRAIRCGVTCGRVMRRRRRKPAPKRPRSSIPTRPTSSTRMAAAAPDAIPATVLFREIQGRGYDGGYGRVKQFVRGLVPA